MSPSALLPLFVASGAAALVDEVAWFQLLALHAGGTSRAMATVLATFMAGLGLGALVVPRRLGSLPPLLACFFLEVAIGLAGLAMPRILDFPPASPPPPQQQQQQQQPRVRPTPPSPSPTPPQRARGARRSPSPARLRPPAAPPPAPPPPQIGRAHV